MRRAILAVPFLIVAASPAGGDITCAGFIDCDCGNIEAGLLTGPWRDDCNACQQRLVEQCEEIYSPSVSIWEAATVGGYCENACSVTGPNPYPPAPEEGDARAYSPPSVGEITLMCPIGAVPDVNEGDGITRHGCRDAEGRPVGLWIAVDAEGNVISEALFGPDGEVIERTDYR